MTLLVFFRKNLHKNKQLKISKTIILIISILIYSCTWQKQMILGECKKKYITNPLLREGIVTIPFDVQYRYFSNTSYELSTLTFKDLYNNERNSFLENSNNFYGLVKDEKYIVIIDSLKPSLNFFETEEMDGPFFYPNERVDTAIGEILKLKNRSSLGYYEVTYSYKIQNKLYKKGFRCEDTLNFSEGLYVGKKYNVIYDPMNNGRAKMLYEPQGFIFKYPRTKF